MILLLLAQAAAASAGTGGGAAPPIPTRIDLLARPCPAATPTTTDRGEIVVCGQPHAAPRLPLPDERAAVGPLPIAPQLMDDPSPKMKPVPCGATMTGCTVGVQIPTPMLQGALGLVKRAFARAPDRTGRVPIDLSDAPAGTAR